MAVPRSWRGLDEFSLPSVPGNEKLASEKVAAAVSGLELPDNRIERLKIAVGAHALTSGHLRHLPRVYADRKSGYLCLSSIDAARS